MEDLLIFLLDYACRKKATDIHLDLEEGESLQIQLRTENGFLSLTQDIFDQHFLEYLKFVSGMDLCALHHPQSGSFVLQGLKSEHSCRFAFMTNSKHSTGVIRLLNASRDLKIPDLSADEKTRNFLNSLTRAEHGLIISAGPTGSGKTTTLHAILHEMASRKDRKIVSLEDPVEISDPLYLQMEINETQGFTYEKGIEELMRHDPDVILIGECRSAYTAHMAVRAALTGHLVFTTLHSGTAAEAVRRMIEFGCDPTDLRTILHAVFAQRLYPAKQSSHIPENQKENVYETEKECIYEKWQRKDIERYFESGNHPEGVLTLAQQIEAAINDGRIDRPHWKDF